MTQYQMLIDITAELFKGELGSIYEIMNNYSLKEIAQFRDVRIKRKKKEEAEEKERQWKEEKERQRRENYVNRKYNRMNGRK